MVSFSLLFVFFLHPELARAANNLLLTLDFALDRANVVNEVGALVLELCAVVLGGVVLGVCVEQVVQPALDQSLRMEQALNDQQAILLGKQRDLQLCDVCHVRELLLAVVGLVDGRHFVVVGKSSVLCSLYLL